MTNRIPKQSLADEVARRLQQQISTGHYEIGHKLPTEPELMKRFGVGRSTIREAVRILSNIGLLRVQQGVGTFVEQKISQVEPMVQRLKRGSFQDLDEVRQILELKIAEKAAERRTDQDILNIKKHLTERDIAGKAGLLEECIAADINFHIAIAKASKNEILVDLYRSVSVHLKKWFLDIYSDTSGFVNTQNLHKQLMEYIVAGDAKKAWNTAVKILNQI